MKVHRHLTEVESFDRKLLFCLVWGIFAVYIVKISDIVYLAMNRTGIDFVAYHGCTPLFEAILNLQFLTIPLMILCFGKTEINASRIIFGGTLAVANLGSYFLWICSSYYARVMNGSMIMVQDTFHDYLMFNSSGFDFALFLLFSLLFIFLTSYSLRFVLYKFHARIS